MRATPLVYFESKNVILDDKIFILSIVKFWSTIYKTLIKKLVGNDPDLVVRLNIK